MSLVVEVALGSLLWVDGRRWDEFGSSVVSEADFPVAVVDFAVVPAAEQDGVVEVGLAAVLP
jgi:hypothetical protein